VAVVVGQAAAAGAGAAGRAVPAAAAVGASPVEADRVVEGVAGDPGDPGAEVVEARADPLAAVEIGRLNTRRAPVAPAVWFCR
jgi:hypothetical protein